VWRLITAGCCALLSRCVVFACNVDAGAAQVPGSLLCLLFDPDNDQMLVKDASGRVFLDHDPAVFSLTLRYLRSSKVTGGAQQQANISASASVRATAACTGLMEQNLSILHGRTVIVHLLLLAASHGPYD